MKASGEQDLSSFSMLDLFRQEAETQTAILNECLLALEQEPGSPGRLAAIMRAAHSLKGAARIVNRDAAVKIAHALEDCFVAAQKGEVMISPAAVDVCLGGVDMLLQIARVPEAEMDAWQLARQAALDDLLARLQAIRSGAAAASPAPQAPLPAENIAPVASAAVCARVSGKAEQELLSAGSEELERAVRVSAANLNRMLGMMSEYMVQTRWLEPFAAELQKLKKHQNELARLCEQVCAMPDTPRTENQPAERTVALRRRLDDCRQLVGRCQAEFDSFARRSADLAERLYREGLVSRMRPFADGAQGFPRMIRDLARRLNKKVRFELVGQNTGVDREILDKLEAPLTQLLRNALDHGLETPEERQAQGKQPEGLLKLEARHQAGLLHVVVADDGRGIDLERIRRKIVARGLSTEELAGRLTDAELLDFLFLPGFSTSEAVTEISGRGVGLDVVRNLTQDVGGLVRAESLPGAGTKFHLQLPVTLSVLRVLLVEIADVPYAIPLTRIERLATVLPEDIRTIEGRRFLTLNERQVGLVDAREALELPGSAGGRASWPVVVIGDRSGFYGLVVDRLVGESKLVVRALDARLGKVRDVSAVSLLDDGAPVIILDTEDLVRSIANLLAGGHLKRLQTEEQAAVGKTFKNILVADDSITVREMERKLLENRGYKVDVTVDGMDAWNTLRMGRYDLVVSDVDMPRLNGIELVRNIRRDARLQALPVIMVSYKDRAEDRLSGLEAGANNYLTKSSFHDETFLKTVVDLIGEPCV